MSNRAIAFKVTTVGGLRRRQHDDPLLLRATPEQALIDTVAKTLSGTQTLTIAGGNALLVAGTAISWNGPSTGVVIENSGTIASTATGGRAINGSGPAVGGRTLTLFNHAGAIIESESDAFRINLDFSVGVVTLHNAGTIRSTVNGQALDFDAIASTAAGQIVINNEATGLIRAAGADAVRPGQNATINNAGMIRAEGPSGESHDTIDFQSHGGFVNNLAGGVISGQRHGVTGEGHLVVNNAAGTLIHGRNGGGVDSDGTGKIVNHGTIIGGNDGSLIGDSDGIDVDSHGEIDNWGLIEAIGNDDPANINEDGEYNYAEGIVIGGGIVHNHDSGIVRSTSTGVGATGALVINEGLIEARWNGMVLDGAELDNRADGEVVGLSGTGVTAFYGATIGNDGLISGAHSGISVLISAEIANRGTIEGAVGIIVQDGATASVLNSGLISGASHAILFGDGNDRLTIAGNGLFVGLVEGGAGTDIVRLEAGALLGAVSGFERLDVAGAARMIAANQFADVTIRAGAGLSLAEGVDLSGAGTIELEDGRLTLEGDLDLDLTMALGGTGTIVKTGAGTLTLGGDNHDFAGMLEIRAGRLAVSDAAGLGAASIDLGHGDAVLAMADGIAPANLIAGFGAGDSIELGAIDFTGAKAIREGGHLRVSDGAGNEILLTLALDGAFRFTLADDGTGHLRLGAAVNSAPTASDLAETIQEDMVYVLDAALLGYADADGDPLFGLRIVAPPVGGSLYFDDIALVDFPTAVFTAADIADGRLTFVPAADLNGAGAASLSFQLLDEAGQAAGGSGSDTHILSFDITPVEDPARARPDRFTITESETIAGGDLFADNGSGADSEPDDDGPLLAISAVNGAALNVGAPIILASGASLRVNANGSFDYDPNGVFLATPAAGSGASNTAASDSFTYTLAGGNTVTVTIILTGLDTDDLLLGTPGADLLAGGTGNDAYVVDTLEDRILENPGEGFETAYVALTLASYALNAGAEVELLRAIDAASTLGLDLTGNEFGNTIIGNDGANVLDGAGGNDSLHGGAGNDGLLGGADDDFLSSGGDDDHLHGEAGQDTLLGGAGDDFLSGGAGINVLYGGTGDDIYIVSSIGDYLVEAAGEGFDIIYTAVDFTLSAGQEIEILSAGDAAGTANTSLGGNERNDILWGNAGANVLTGGLGNDSLHGFAGNDGLLGGDGNDFLDGAEGDDSLHGEAGQDTLLGGGGNDFLSGGGGADVMYGGTGNDTYIVDAGDYVVEAAGEGVDVVYASQSYALAAGSEIELLSTGDISGTAAINLTGNELANTLQGNAGANVLDGKGGNDLLIGLAGADTFAFTTALGAGNVDSVSGFERNVDKIALDDAIFTAIGGPGALNANAFVTGVAAVDASDRIVHNILTGQLFYDADGAGGSAAILFATLSPGLALTASDFQVI